MTIEETQPIKEGTVLYRCTCGEDVCVDRELGGKCENCGHVISSKVVNNDLTATMTLAGPVDGSASTHFEIEEPENESSLVGKIYGHFELIKPLGRGGAGFVYQAVDTSLQRYVAVKVLRGGGQSNKTLDNESETDLLLQEAIAQARVAHPNIVTIYYVGKQDDEPFYAMELVDGISLSERIRNGAFKFAEISSVAENMTEALRSSFSMDIIHGDIKPSNILLTRTGGAKLSDFGLARRASEDNKIAKGGTPNYLAPELLYGESPSKQSDMYALGVTLYEMTFGYLPIKVTGTTAASWQKSHDNVQIEFPTEWPEHLPPNWKPFLAKLLQKNPRHRFSSYDELASVLAKLTPRGDVMAQPMPRLVAALIDFLTVLLLMSPVRMLINLQDFEPHPVVWVAILLADFVPIIAYTTLVFFWKQSVGRKLMQLRVINKFGVIPKGRKMAMRSMLRMIIPWFQAAMLIFFFANDSWLELVPTIVLIGVLIVVAISTLMMFFSKDKKSLHDRIFDTRVVIDS